MPGAAPPSSSGGSVRAGGGGAVGGRLKLKGIGFLGAPSRGAASSSSAAASSSSTAAGLGAKRPRPPPSADELAAGGSSASSSAAWSAAGAGAGRGAPAAASAAASAAAPASAASAAAAAAAAPTMTAATRTLGSGVLQTSGSTVMGRGTRFLAELAVGDAIEVELPAAALAGDAGDDGSAAPAPEVRVVKMVLSDTSAGLNAPFSADLASGARFHVLKLPRAIVTPAMAAAAAAAQRAAEEQAAYGRYAAADGKLFTYRERKAQGTYAIKTVTLDTAHTREQLLEMRAKVKSDKFC